MKNILLNAQSMATSSCDEQTYHFPAPTQPCGLAIFCRLGATCKVHSLSQKRNTVIPGRASQLPHLCNSNHKFRLSFLLGQPQNTNEQLGNLPCVRLQSGKWVHAHPCPSHVPSMPSGDPTIPKPRGLDEELREEPLKIQDGVVPQ